MFVIVYILCLDFYTIVRLYKLFRLLGNIKFAVIHHLVTQVRLDLHFLTYGLMTKYFLLYVISYIRNLCSTCSWKLVLTDSRVYYELVSRQLLSAGERRWEQLRQMFSDNAEVGGDGTFVFIGEVISRLCRRGQAGMLHCTFLILRNQYRSIFK